MKNTLQEEIDKLLKTSPTFRDMYQRAATDAVAERFAQSRKGWPAWVEDALLGAKKQEKEAAIQEVEAKVKELRERVRLDTISKTASVHAPFPMSLKAILVAEKAENDAADVADPREQAMSFIKDFVSAHRGNCDPPAIVYELKKLVGHDYVDKNKDAIDSFIDQMVKIYQNHQDLGRADNSKPIPLGSLDNPEDRQLFKDIVKNLGHS